VLVVLDAPAPDPVADISGGGDSKIRRWKLVLVLLVVAVRSVLVGNLVTNNDDTDEPRRGRLDWNAKENVVDVEDGNSNSKAVALAVTITE